MIDISGKQTTKRTARAEGKIVFCPAAYKILLKQGSPKGDVMETAKIAGIMAAKNTPALIPLCHPLALEKVSVSFEMLKSKNTVKVFSEVSCSGKTGVEMEALAAVTAACLTIYDMMKFTGQDMTIDGIRLMHKSGGRTGTWQR
ncbi:MAG: cyclic pyranopterin monophosphate synthase MoaC [Candidatus Omnitrophica bacterium]|nr:cyclic pyranopterin monophosphate synthase MoaC [Candidatus Omnitrophota bacterium]MDE2010123.1 cyclic pyranopterin monophosphate synthase MoaC [Candidatus Omnitrophota bacterium]MDE2231059.1 cyclic pyranopterin monophosphate synthase MoaC [Candidatus Omnitrophota bacterium]